MNVVIFGTGLYYQNRKDTFSGIHIVAFLDNSPEKQGQILDGASILPPEKINQLEYDYLCIMAGPKIYGEMESQIYFLGVPIQKVVSFQGMQRLLTVGQQPEMGGMIYTTPQGWMPENKRRVLIITHELTLSGAPVVLLYMAKVLKTKDLQPTVLSPLDGKLRQRFLDEGIPVVVDAHLNAENGFLLDWMGTFDLIVICTLTFGEFVGKISKNFPKPILWWLHEGTEVYSGWWPRAKPEFLGKNVHIYTGGARAMQVYRQYFENDAAKMLLYGIPDENPSPEFGYRRMRKDGKVVFALVAVIQPRKGQDLYLDAIKLLTEEERSHAEFWLVGPYTDVTYPEFNEKLRQDAAVFPAVQLKGEWPMEKLIAEYANIDVMVCPSRDDPMPVVLPEAMMFYKTCICSVESGTSYFIEHEKNGLVCQVDAVSIAAQMRWVLEHTEKLPEMGIESRRLFEKTFSLEAFEKNLMQAVEDCTGEPV